MALTQNILFEQAEEQTLSFLCPDKVNKWKNEISGGPIFSCSFP